MSFYNVNGSGLLIGPGGVLAVDLAGSPPSGEITPLVTAEYVDTAGDVQVATIESGVTSISGVAPFMMHIDASGSRFPTAYAAQGAITDAEAYAYLMGGYRLNYGEDIGGTWTFGGASRDEDTGPPIFGRVFTEIGTHIVRLKLRDALGNEQTVSWNVVVSAPASPTIIEVAAGAWPTWVNGTHYALRAGGNYTSFGAIDTREKHSILISKTGAGADPIVGTFRPDGRNLINAPEGSWVLSRNIRTLDIDVALFSEGGVQFIHGGVVRGRCRTYEGGIREYYYTADATNDNSRSSIRRARGIFLWDCGEMNRGPDNYVMIGDSWKRHVVGVDANMESPAGASVACMRLYDHESTIRHSRIANSYQDGQMQTWISLLGTSAGLDYPSYTAVTWTAQIGAANGSPSYYKVINRKHVVQNCVFGRVGQPWPNAPGSIGGPTNTAWVSELYGVEDSTSPLSEPTDFGVNSSITMTGKYHFRRNWKYATGGSVGVSTSSGPDAAFNGPYLNETDNSRPVPTAF